MDSGVRLVGMEEEMQVPLGERPPSSGTESDIRLGEGSGRIARGEAAKAPPRADDSMTTEEIDLDAELRKAAESAQTKKPGSKLKPKTDVKAKAPPETAPAPKKTDSDEELRLEPPSDEDVNLGELVPGEGLSGPSGASGINLDNPADSGINLEKKEQSDDSLEFELSLDQPATPKPTSDASDVDSSGEFELTLDDSGGLAPLEDEAGAGSEKDIFETDFDMPALDEESASEAVALDESDTELESSDFDL
jgi:hypothetical protein